MNRKKNLRTFFDVTNAFLFPWNCQFLVLFTVNYRFSVLKFFGWFYGLSKCSLFNDPWGPFLRFFLDNEVWIYGTCGHLSSWNLFHWQTCRSFWPNYWRDLCCFRPTNFQRLQLASFGLEAPQFSEGPTPFPTYLQSSLSVLCPKGTSTN